MSFKFVGLKRGVGVRLFFFKFSWFVLALFRFWGFSIEVSSVLGFVRFSVWVILFRSRSDFCSAFFISGFLDLGRFVSYFSGFRFNSKRGRLERV